MIKKVIEYLNRNYSQDNPPPQTLDLEIGIVRVHIELMPCFGIATYYYDNRMVICEFHEDDGHFFEGGIETYDPAWLTSRIGLYTRMYLYLEANCLPGYYYGYEGIESHKCGYSNWK